MKKTRIVSGVLAGVMAASMCSVALTASAATTKKITKLTATNAKAGITLKWKKVKGVKSYKVYRKGTKKALKTVKKVTFTDKTAKAGKTYTYTIKATGAKAASVKVVRLVAPTISSVKMTKNKDGYPDGLKLTWKKAKGAKKYIVYRKDSKKYAKVATVKKLTYTDKTLSSDVKYTYKVKAVNGKSTSVASAAKKGVVVDSPDKVTLKLNNNGTYKLSWSKVKYASSYTIYDSNGKKVKTVKTNSYSGKLTGDNLQVVVFTVKTNYAGNASWGQSGEGLYVPDGSHYHDQYGNICIKIALKEKEQFMDGAFLDLILKASSINSYSVDKGTDTNVAELDENFIIKAKNAGFTKFKITYDEAAAKVITDTLAQYGLKFNNKLSTGTAYVEVTVTK